MATKRTGIKRSAWESVAARLSVEAKGRKAIQSGEGHPVTVDGGEQRRSGGVGSSLELSFFWQLRAAKIVGYVMEHKFHPTRRWRFDFCWPEEKIAVEIEGGTWSGGRHTTGSGFKRDCEKYNHAAMMGFYVYRFTGDMVKNNEAIEFMKEVMNGRDQSE